MTVHEGAIDSHGVSIHYLDWGAPADRPEAGAPPLILIHATGFLAALWRPIAEQLSNAYRVVAMDQRGHGDSDKPAGGYTFELLADDTQRLIDELGLERPLVVGHSSGGTTVVVHADKYPGVIQRSVLIEPILPRPEWYEVPNMNPNLLAEGARKRRAVRPSRDEMFEAYRTRPMFERWREDVLHTYVDEGTADRDDGQVELKCPPEVEAQFFEAVTKIDAWPHLAEFTMPTLVLWGAESHLITRGLADQVDEALPNAETVLVDGTTHFLPQERPDEVARLIEQFLSD
ncbi:MAG: alpha/beta hydrolase [Chloroflexi bacterium]|nr:alpha/beta hydrolase [Chloroflexota bacterium]